MIGKELDMDETSLKILMESIYNATRLPLLLPQRGRDRSVV